MKRSKKIPLFALGIVAAATLAGCSKEPTYDEQKNCVDDKGVVVPDSNCNVAPSGGGHIPYYWYYGGNRLFHPGMVVGGGSRSPTSGRSYFAPSSPHFSSSPSVVSRGGFGSSSHGSIGG